ncbi:MAG: glutathionylspermidine synthase family protein [Phycisphaerales bacterium]
MHPLAAGPMLDADAARRYRLRAVFECGKLDPQVGDTSVLAPFPLLLQRDAHRGVCTLAERLDAEARAAEAELVARPDLHRHLALPRHIRRALAAARAGDSHARQPTTPRVSRLDFHWCRDTDSTADCWRISEINADVPGGFIEAGPITRLMRDLIDPPDGPAPRSNTARTPQPAELPPDPADALARAISDRLNADAPRTVALVHATAYADDYQVMRRLAACLEAHALSAVLAAPDHILWDHHAHAWLAPTASSPARPLGAILRFYPAEWLPTLGRIAEWPRYFRPGRTLLCNPATALLTQSKRWPLLWDRLTTPVPTWRDLLPETRAVMASRGLPDRADWVLKPALGRIGEDILVPGIPSRHEPAIRRAIRRRPANWIAQRRFESLPVPTPLGDLHVCLGVFVVDGRAAGLYARAATRPLIDQSAWELPVLVSPVSAACPAHVPEQHTPARPTEPRTLEAA